mmetsp:Transcript_88492/g.176926  ORF Transcript_88492/g.176926 Transcript_88492/m.176926 type:complete len:228 (-) Transcript_88492:572-1255(-)
MVARCLTFLFTAVVIVHSQEIAEWESWLTQSGLSQAKYENLIGETASSLNMSNQELHDSLVSNAASVQNDPVSLLIQLRDELQIVTDLDGLEVANENEDEDDTMQYAHGQEEAALNEDDVGETALEPSSHYKEDDEVLQELDRLLDAGLGLNETVYGQERKGVWDSIEEVCHCLRPSGDSASDRFSCLLHLLNYRNKFKWKAGIHRNMLKNRQECRRIFLTQPPSLF